MSKDRSSDRFRVNEYAWRVGKVTRADLTDDGAIVEVSGYWQGHGGGGFNGEFVPAAMHLSQGDHLYVVQQTAGPGQRGAWVGFTSDGHDESYVVRNVPGVASVAVVDWVGGAANAVIELGAVVALAWVGWNYRWWLAMLVGATALAVAAKPYATTWRERQKRRHALADEQELFAIMPAHLTELKQKWIAENPRPNSERARDDDWRESTGETMNCPWRETLGVSHSCTADDAERAGRQKLMEYHPDRHMQLPIKLREGAAAETRRILEAMASARAYFAVP